MEKQMIIAIGREYGSGGHEIGQKLAEKLQINFYDRNVLDRAAEERAVDASKLRKYEDKPRNLLLSRTVRGFSNSPEENVAHMEFDFLKGKAESGESFVIVGRCGEDILKEYEGLISIFILADMNQKIEHIKQVRDLSDLGAESAIYRHDKKRKAYHNYY